VKYDGTLLQLQTLQQIIEETNSKLLTQSDLVTNLEFQIVNYNSQIRALDDQIRLEVQLRQEFEKVLKREKRKSAIYKVTSIVGATATLLLLVK